MTRLFVILIVLLAGCGSEEGELKKFTRADFDKSVALTAKEESLPDGLLTPIIINVVRDSIMIVQNLPVEDEDFHFVEIYNMVNKSLMCRVLPYGRGPGEWLSCKIEEINEYEIIVHDDVTHHASIFVLDSLMQHKKDYQPLKVKLPDFTGTIVRFDEEEFVASDSRFFRTSIFQNEGISRLFKFPIKGMPQKELSEFRKVETKNFVANVSQVKIASSKKEGAIFVVDLLRDEIEQYTNDLHLGAVLKGPDDFKIEYHTQNNTVLTRGYYASFYGVQKATDGIYCIYAGRHKVEEDYQSPVEILKINWAGNLDELYNLDVFSFDLSVDKKRNKMYTVGFDPDTGVSFYSFDIE